MFAKIVALFALLAVAFAAPSPNPKPQVLAYSAGFDYVYPGSPSYVSPVSYSVAGAPVAYSALPGAVYYR